MELRGTLIAISDEAGYEAALHENYHVGEIGALRKALGKPSLG